MYADWLIAQGDPRGELIVLQRRIQHAADDAAREELERASEALFEQHPDALAGPFTPYHAVWKDGFVQ